MNEKYYRLSVVILLALIFVAVVIDTGLRLQNAAQEKARQEERAEQLETQIETEINLMTLNAGSSGDLVTLYMDLAYGNPNVDRISEQQLLATETNMDIMANISEQLDSLAKLLLLMD
ncbi:MAG: hypothetical protein FVQ83_10685 [Chloroflexi bacterium]|nr:hypothetical protein [Chloroflexota bacterium]